jgi:hypothetical protein
MTGHRSPGRTRQCPDDVLLRVVVRRQDGASLQKIADELNAESVPTPGGRPAWMAIHVSRLLKTNGGMEFTERVRVACRLEEERRDEAASARG